MFIYVLIITISGCSKDRKYEPYKQTSVERLKFDLPADCKKVISVGHTGHSGASYILTYEVVSGGVKTISYSWTGRSQEVTWRQLKK